MATPIDPRLYGGATPSDPYSKATANRTGPVEPVARFLWSNVAKPVVRGTAKPFFGFASGITGKDYNVVIPGTRTEIGSGHQMQDYRDERSGKITAAELKARQKKQFGSDMGDALAIGTTALPGGRLVSSLGGKAAGAVGRAGGNKVLQALAKTGVNATSDYTLGAGFGVASALAEGETDPLKILSRANTTGLFGAALPIGFAGAGAAVPLARKGAAKVLLGDSKAKFGDALEQAEKGWAAKRAAVATSAKNAERGMVTVKSPDGKELQIQQRFAKANFTAPNADRGFVRNKLVEIADSVKGAAESTAAAGVRTLRRLDQNFLNSEAPIEALAAKMEAHDPEAAVAMRKAQSEFQAKTDIAAGRAFTTHDEITNGMLKGDPRLNSAFDQMSDVRTKLETVRDTATPEARAALQADLDKTLNQLSPTERAAVEEAHKAMIKANEANLDRLVEGGILSKEKAAMLKEKHPNYSKLLVKEYTEGGSNMFGGQASQKALKETGLKSRKTGADFDITNVGASEANTLNHAMTEERVMTNLRNQSIVDADMKNGTGMFKPLWTADDEKAKQALIGEMTQYAGIKDALNAEVGNVKAAGTLGLLKQKAADRKQSMRLSNQEIGGSTARKSFLSEAEDERWNKILNSTDEQLKPLVDELATTNEVKSKLYTQIKALRDKAKQATQSETAVPVFRNGVKELHEPTDPRLGEYFKRQNEAGIEAPKFVEGLSNFTKKFATQLNPVFTLKNFMRDQQDRLANIGLGFSPKRLARATTEAWEHVNGRPTELTLRAARLGGPLSSAGYDMSSGFRRLAEKGGKKGVVGTVSNLAEASELATRINILQEAEAAGITDPQQLRDLMRNGTLDFSIGGDMAKQVNKWIPFTTAAINGLRTQLKSLTKDPAGYARRQQILAVYPQLLLDSHNKQYDSASTIPQNDRNLNHIFVYGEGTDSDGKKFPKYFKIPKGQATRLFSNITRIITNENLEPEEMSRYIVKQFGTMIPIVNSESSTPVPMPFGSIGQAIYGIQTNKDYMGRDIVSQGNLNKSRLGQTNKFTSDLAKDSAKALAEVTGIELSPAKMEYFFRTAGSGAGSTILSAANNIYDVARGKKLTGTQDDSLSAKAASAAITQGFIGTGSSGVDLGVTAKNAEALKAKQDADFQTSERYKANMDEMKNAKTQEEKEAVLKSLQERGELTPDFQKYVIAESKKKTGVFAVDPTASSNMKAIQMTNYLNTLDGSEAQQAAIKDFGAKNLLTPDVQDSLVAYKLYKKLNGATPADITQMVQSFEEKGLMNDNVKKKILEYKKGKAP